jgi:DNA-binding NarL/FixJ family response regulator
MTRAATATYHKARVLIVDDHPLVRRGLTDLINAEPDLGVCGEAEDAAGGLERLATDPDVVIIDISLKKGDGVELVKQVKACRPDAKILVCSMHDEAIFAPRALRAGATGYISKQEATERIIEAIRRVLGGELFLSGRMTTRFLGDRAQSGPRRQPLADDRLSDRELAVYELIGQGCTTRAIAGKLGISIKTVETHREHIKAKLNLANSAELSRHAVLWMMGNA